MRKSASAYFHPSNAVTYLSLLAGLLAVVTAKEWRSWSAAGGLLALSALADTLDGRFAGCSGGTVTSSASAWSWTAWPMR